jgi:hypothetical protein
LFSSLEAAGVLDGGFEVLVDQLLHARHKRFIQR